MNVLILGGSGRQAESIVLDLLQVDTDNISEITLASIEREALKARVAQLRSSKVKWEVIDITDNHALVKLMKKHGLVFNAASTPTVPLAVKAALEAGVNLATLEGLDQHMVVPEAPCDEFGFVDESYRAELDEQFRQAGIVGILGWGYVPGTANVIGRMLGDQFDTINSMTWYFGAAQTGDKLFFSETPRETIWLHRQPGVILQDGRYERVPPKSGRETVSFPAPLGEVEVQHMPLMSTVPVFANRYKSKNIQNIEVKLGYWRGYLEKMDFLEGVGLLDLDAKDIGDAHVAPADVFLAGPHVADKRGAHLLDYGCLRLVVDGVIGDHKVAYTGDVLARPLRNLAAMQLMTGIPAAVGLQMMATGELSKRGLYSTADDEVDPGRYFQELGRRGYSLVTTRVETVVG